MSLISANQHSQYNCVNMWLGSDSTNIPVCLSCAFNTNSWGCLFFYLVLFSLCWILRFSDSSHSDTVLLKTQSRSYSTRTYLTGCRGRQNVCCITGDLSTRKLILHQVSSIFLGSGSRGKRSLDTRRTACSARPRGGLYGRKHLRIPPASRLQTKTRNQPYVSLNLSQYFYLFCSKIGKTCFLAPPRLNSRGTLYIKKTPPYNPTWKYWLCGWSWKDFLFVNTWVGGHVRKIESYLYTYF